jgi:hypothetical protein
MDITPYKLPDDAFYEGEDRGADRLARDLVGEYRGLLIDAPSRVNLADRSHLPGAIYHLGAIRDLAAVPFDRFGVITAMNVSTHRLYAAGGSALLRDDDLVEAPPVAPEDLPEGDMSTTYPLDLRAILGLPWEPGRYLLTALQRETVSNRAQVELVRPEGSTPTPASLAVDEAVSPAPEAGVFSYQADAQSPALPEGFGIQLSPRRVVVLKQDLRWPVHGTFRLPTQAGSGFSVHLLVSGADDGSVAVIHLHVPPTGHFTVDLGRLLSFRRPQTYFLSAFSGSHLAGPVPTALVADNR